MWLSGLKGDFDITEVRFHASNVFMEEYLTEFSSENKMREMIESMKEFEKFYNPFEEKMQELLGGTLPDSFIDVNIFTWKSGKKSKSMPLLIWIRTYKPHLTLKNLIHEIVHNCLSVSPEYEPFRKIYKSKEKAHYVVNWATEKIMLSLFNKEELEKYKVLEYPSKEYEEWRVKGLEKLEDTTNLLEKLKNGFEL